MILLSNMVPIQPDDWVVMDICENLCYAEIVLSPKNKYFTLRRDTVFLLVLTPHL